MAAFRTTYHLVCADTDPFWRTTAQDCRDEAAKDEREAIEILTRPDRSHRPRDHREET